jgi:hypothetical protein
VIAASTRVQLPAVDVERLAFLEICDRRSRELVTVIFWPARPISSRATCSAAGPRCPPSDRTNCVYPVLVSRAEQRPHASFWPTGLRDLLPDIPVPLRASDSDTRLGLQGILDHIHDTGGYAYPIYEGAPEPTLGPDETRPGRGPSSRGHGNPSAPLSDGAPATRSATAGVQEDHRRRAVQPHPHAQRARARSGHGRSCSRLPR